MSCSCLFLTLQQLGGVSSGGAWWSYAVMDNDTYLGDHFSMSPGYLCHDSCATFPFEDDHLDDGRWHHLSLAWRLTGAAKLYIDGVLAYELTPPDEAHPLLPGGDLFLGQDSGTFEAFNGLGFSSSQPPHGQMDNFRIWNTVRTADEVTAFMYEAIDGLEAIAMPNLLASLTFDGRVHVDLASWPDNTFPNKLFAYQDALGNTVRGGYGGCTDNASLPTWTSSSAPIHSAGAAVVTEVFGHGFPALLPLPFSFHPSDCAGTGWESVTVEVTVASLPFNGSLLRLDNSTVLSVGNSVDLFNGTHSVVVNSTTGACDVLGSGLVLYAGPIDPVIVDIFTYTVTVMDMVTSETVTSNATTVVLYPASGLKIGNANVPTMQIGKLTPFDTGLYDSGEFFSVTLCASHWTLL